MRGSRPEENRLFMLLLFTLSADEAELRGQLEPNLPALDTKVHFASVLMAFNILGVSGVMISAL